jgi:hypothetical protein
MNELLRYVMTVFELLRSYLSVGAIYLAFQDNPIAEQNKRWLRDVRPRLATLGCAGAL